MTDETAKPGYTFTVYTGTRNRARTLDRPYQSLRSQTFRDFEWLVVDNESTDGTTELIAKWQAEADFPDPLHPSRESRPPRFVQRRPSRRRAASCS